MTFNISLYFIVLILHSTLFRMCKNSRTLDPKFLGFQSCKPEKKRFVNIAVDSDRYLKLNGQAKSVAFIAGKKNPAIQNFFIRFSIEIKL